MSNAFLQIAVGICFFMLVVVLFFEKADYLTYSFILIIVAGLISAVILPEEVANLEFFIETIDWEVVIFLIGMFTIVEILNEKRIFQEMSRRIVNKYKNNVRAMFYVICLLSTLVASVLEDLSVAIIFGPIIVMACVQIRINPTPFLLGMTICINLAATLTPFGSAQNVLIVNALDLDFLWFLTHFGFYFVGATFITLFLLDKFVLPKYINEGWMQACVDADEIEQKREEHKEQVSEEFADDHVFYHPQYTEEGKLSDIVIENKTFYKNIIGLVVFVVLLIVIPTLYLPCLISVVIFVLMNPVTDKRGHTHPSISHYFKRVDYKLIYFFICLFILVGLMEANGTIIFLENVLIAISTENLFLICLVILIVSSILSAFMDNAPVTIIFIPIVSYLVGDPLADPPGLGLAIAPIMVAFVLGINLGGNFLPQGSACDMMTLEIARENCVDDLTYKKLFKVGGLFAVLHILLGIIYLAVLIFLIL